MKKFKKVINKLPKKSIAIVMILAIVLNYIIPLTKVFADTYTYKLTFTIHSGNQNQHTMVNENGILKIDGQYVELRDGNNQRIGIVACADGPVCTITVTDGPKATLNYNGNNSYSLYMKGHDVGYDFEFQANEAIAVQDYIAPQQNDNPAGPEPGEGFDGRAVVLWSCGNGVCYHQFDVVDPEHCDPEHPTDACNPEIGNFNNGNSTFFRDTYVTADNKDDPDIYFDVNAEYREWYLQDEFDKWKSLYRIANNMAENATINWDTVDPRLIMGDPKDRNELTALEETVTEANYCAENESMEDCVNRYAATINHKVWTHELQPVNEPNAKNAYVSYGDRNFKVVIYNEKYRGVTTGDLTGLTYYPAAWADPYLRTDQYDISETTKSKPALLDSILLENIVNINALNYNGLEIASITPLDVPADAVTVTPTGNKFSIEFSSHFYDNVVFKVKDTDNEEYFIKIKRYTIDAWFAHDDSGDFLRADFYYANNKSYTDFNITAKIVYKDGTTKLVTLTPQAHVEDGLGNGNDNYYIDQEHPNSDSNNNQPMGKGLYLSTFRFNLENGEKDTIQDIYMNAEYKGNDPTVYPGAYSGSGEGTLANIFHPEEEH